MSKNIDFGPAADLYDVYVQWDTDVPFFRRRCAGVAGEVLELMCGTGRLTLPLLEGRLKLCCVDYSREMLDVLRRKLGARGLSADVIEADVRELDLGRSFERVLLPFHSLSEILEPADRVRAHARVRKHLTPGGRYVVTLQNPAVQVPGLDGRRRKICEAPMPGKDAVLRVWSTARHDAALGRGEAVQEYEILGQQGELLDRRTLALRFAIIDRDTFEGEAAAAGFEVLRLWGDYEGGPFDPGRSPYMLWELGARS